MGRQRASARILDGSEESKAETLMRELFYFSFADLMARIEYHRAANALRYVTHRKMTFQERFLVEQHLLASFAQKTDYYERQPALFIYLGIDEQLALALDKFHSRESSQQVADEEVAASVGDLISRSMERYYFEQIGDTILEARRNAVAGVSGLADEQRDRRRAKLEELVEAYNVYAGQRITLAEIVPTELKPCFGLKQEDGDEQPGGMLSENWRNHAPRA